MIPQVFFGRFILGLWLGWVLALMPPPILAQTPTPTVADTAQYNFENGTLQNFQVASVTCCTPVPASVSVTSSIAYAGTHSAAISILNWVNGNDFLFLNYTDSVTVVGNFTAQIYTNNPNIQFQAFVQDNAYNWYDTGLFTNSIAGQWTTITFNAGSTIAGPDKAFGLKLINNTGSAYTGLVYIDSIAWDTPTPTFTPTITPTPTQTFPSTPTPISTPPPPSGRPYVYANPSNGPTVHFVYQMAGSGRVRITLLNDAGDVVATLSDIKPSGIQETALNIQAFAPGHYFYMIELDYDSGSVEKLSPQVLAIQK
jgi:hypothetical protein